MFSAGHGEYSYQQSSYGEQGYERSFDESSQHYYEGGNSHQSTFIFVILNQSLIFSEISSCHFSPHYVLMFQTKTIVITGFIANMWTCLYVPPGNPQYSQQQAQYQQGSGQQQPFSQQQYSSQQGYSGQAQGYG